MDLWQETFHGRVISCRGDINWPPRSFDLIPLGYFLWGYAKDRAYADKPSNLEHLKTNIRQVMAEIPPNMCVKKWSKITSKESMLSTLTRGGHLNDVVFHT